jgi:hypothetical protein
LHFISLLSIFATVLTLSGCPKSSPLGQFLPHLQASFVAFSLTKPAYMIFANWASLEAFPSKFSAFSDLFVLDFLVMAFSPQIPAFLEDLPNVQPKEEHMLMYQALGDCL